MIIHPPTPPYKGKFGNNIIVHDIYFSGYFSSRHMYFAYSTSVMHKLTSQNRLRDRVLMEGELITKRFPELTVKASSLDWTTASEFNALPYHEQMEYIDSLGEENWKDYNDREGEI